MSDKEDRRKNGGNIISPEELTPDERAYYREVWGFDPVEDKKEPSRSSNEKDDDVFNPEGVEEVLPVLYYYEASVPLENDPELQAAGVTMHARVEVDEEGVSHNRLLFKRGKKSALVNCVHTAVYAAPAREVFELPEERLEEIADTTEGRPTLLPSWEHFAALKSFAGGIAAVGIFSFLGFARFIKNDPTSNNDLFNSITAQVPEWGPFDQIRKALLKLAPEIIFPVWDAAFADLLDQVSVQWILERSVFPENPDLFGKFVGVYPLKRVFNNHPFLESLDSAAREKLCYLLLEIEHSWDEDDRRSEDNEVEMAYSPRILILALTEIFVARLDPETTYQTLKMLDDYQWYCRPENESASPGKVRAKELEAPFYFLLRRGLAFRKSPHLESICRFFHHVPNPLEMKDPRAVFDDPDFTVPRLLHGFDAVHLREILRAETKRWQEVVANVRLYLPYHCMRLLLEREGLSPENAECLRALVTHRGDEWKDRYLPALVREFNFSEDFIHTTSQEYDEKENALS